MSSQEAYVTITAPLLFTQEKITCAGVAPSLSPIAFKTGSTGPPGVLVIGLKNGYIVKNKAATQTHTRTPLTRVSCMPL